MIQYQNGLGVTEDIQDFSEALLVVHSWLCVRFTAAERDVHFRLKTSRYRGSVSNKVALINES